MSFDSVERVAHLTPESFVRDYRSRNRPVIVTNEAALRSAAATWTLDYLVAKHPAHKVSVQHCPSGDRSQWWTYEEMELARYIELVRTSPATRGTYYLAEQSVTQVFPRTAHEIPAPTPLVDAAIAEVVAFAGVDTFFSAHYHRAPMESMLAQVGGNKQVLLYSPGNFARLRPHPWYSARGNWSRLPMTASTDVASAVPAKAHACTLAPGEMLFIPQGWFHVVRGVGESVSLTYFFRGTWRDAHLRIAARDFGWDALLWLVTKFRGKQAGRE